MTQPSYIVIRVKGYYFEEKIFSKIALENCYFTVQNTIEQLSIKVITYVEKDNVEPVKNMILNAN